MWMYWVVAILFTVAIAMYQKMTGPTYPKNTKVVLNDNEYKMKLPRSHGGDDGCVVSTGITDPSVSAVISYRRYPTNDEWITADLIASEDGLSFKLPWQPPAGKLQYFFQFTDKNGTTEVFSDEPIVIRFKGGVPAWIIIPHVIFIFGAMLISTLAAMLAIGKMPKVRFYSVMAVVFLFIGGLILGPIVQKYAFGEFWTGFPFGYDLTDNKTLLAFIVWALALLLNLKKERRFAVIIATVFLLGIFSIPHSMFGSELNYESGKVQTGQSAGEAE